MTVTTEVLKCRECTYMYPVKDKGTKFYVCSLMFDKYGIMGSTLKNIDVISDECPIEVKKEAVSRIKQELETHKKSLSKEYKVALDVAVEAIEKQTPKKMKVGKEFLLCPGCNRPIGYIYADFPKGVTHHFDFKYCGECGQAIYEEGVEE